MKIYYLYIYDNFKHLLKNPIDLFKRFFNEAKECKQIIEANTMFVATCSDKFPTLRPVLLKEIRG